MTTPMKDALNHAIWRADELTLELRWLARQAGMDNDAETALLAHTALAQVQELHRRLIDQSLNRPTAQEV